MLGISSTLHYQNGSRLEDTASLARFTHLLLYCELNMENLTNTKEDAHLVARFIVSLSRFLKMVMYKRKDARDEKQLQTKIMKFSQFKTSVTSIQ